MKLNDSINDRCIEKNTLDIRRDNFGKNKIRSVQRNTGTGSDAARAVIEELRNDQGCLMPIMQKAQDIYGYLPYEVQKIISDELDVPMEKIYGVATFYSQFNLYPKGQYKTFGMPWNCLLCKRFR